MAMTSWKGILLIMLFLFWALVSVGMYSYMNGVTFGAPVWEIGALLVLWWLPYLGIARWLFGDQRYD